jgi:hypothetical protein
MEESSKSTKKKSTVARLFSGLKARKNKGHSDVLPELVPFDHIQNTSPPAGDQGANAIARSPPNEPPTQSATDPVTAAIENNDTANTDMEGEMPPKDVAFAQKRLNEAAAKLEKNISAELLASRNFEIKGSADVNSLANNIGSALVMIMEQRDVEKPKQSHARDLVTEWAKKTIPFIETGLTVTNVRRTT